MKYKKIIAALLTLSMLTACNSRPKYLSDEMYNYAESAIKAADAYMDNQMSYEDAYLKLDGLRDHAEKLHGSSDNTTNNIAYYSISHLCTTLHLEHSGSYTYADLLEARNDLAENIGYSERD